MDRWIHSIPSKQNPKRNTQNREYEIFYLLNMKEMKEEKK